MFTEMRDLPYLIGDLGPVYMEASYLGRRVTWEGELLAQAGQGQVTRAKCLH